MLFRSCSVELNCLKGELLEKLRCSSEAQVGGRQCVMLEKVLEKHKGGRVNTGVLALAAIQVQ